MRGVVLCVVAALGINAIAAAEPASASMAAANQSYKPTAAARPAVGPPLFRFYQRGVRSWVWRTPWW